MTEAATYSNADCPPISLDRSVKAVRAIVEHGETEVATKQLGSIWGFVETSAGHTNIFRKSLVQFGLFNPLRRGLYEVTALATMILDAPSREARQTALIKALTRPDAYRYLWDSLSDPKQRLSERQVRSKLEQCGITDERTVVRAARLFCQSVRFVMEAGESQDPEAEVGAARQQDRQQFHLVGPHDRRRGPELAGFVEFCRNPVGRSTQAVILAKGPMGPFELDSLIEVLTQNRQSLLGDSAAQGSP